MKYLLLIALALSWAACNNCRYVDCAGNDQFGLRFASRSDSADLITSGAYSIDSLRITAILKDLTTVTAPVFIQAYTNKNYACGVYVDTDISGYAIRLDTLPADTIWITTHRSADEKCCGGVLLLDQIIWRGDTLSPGQINWSLMLYL